MTTGPTAGAWHHIVGTYDGTTMTLYQDGAVVTTLAKTGSIAPSSAEPQVYIGQGDLPENVAWSGQYVGDLDELRISTVARSANWILTEYRNQSAPASFYAVGGETAAGVALPAYTVNLRSIGSGGSYGVGTVNATLGSVVVDGVGTLWKTNNRGRGDRITINAVDYTILAVESETRLRLTSPFTSATNSYTYTIARKFGDPQSWENCVSGGACAGVSSVSLVQDNRSEVGIYYYDGSNPVGFPVDHVRRLDHRRQPHHHADGGPGQPAPRAGRGLADVGDLRQRREPAATVQINDDYVTVEWLELKMWSGSSTSAHGVEIGSLTAGANHVVVRNNVIHTTGSGVLISDGNAVVDVYKTSSTRRTTAFASTGSTSPPRRGSTSSTTRSTATTAPSALPASRPRSVRPRSGSTCGTTSCTATRSATSVWARPSTARGSTTAPTRTSPPRWPTARSTTR